MTQNTSHAVMAQRHEPHDSLDDFPTPPWATRALVEHILWPNLGCYDPAARLKSSSVWEPASNRGHMALPLREYFRRVDASDIHDYSFDPHLGFCQDRVVDFLFPGSQSPMQIKHPAEWIITNPPFRLAEQFVHRSFEVGASNVCLLVRTAFLEGIGRYEKLFRVNPPTIIAQFTERVVMVKGRLDGEGSTATAYCWLIWMEGCKGTSFKWIPPCRKRLERDSDYAE